VARTRDLARQTLEPRVCRSRGRAQASRLDRQVEAGLGWIHVPFAASRNQRAVRPFFSTEICPPRSSSPRVARPRARRNSAPRDMTSARLPVVVSAGTMRAHRFGESADASRKGALKPSSSTTPGRSPARPPATTSRSVASPARRRTDRPRQPRGAEPGQSKSRITQGTFARSRSSAGYVRRAALTSMSLWRGGDGGAPGLSYRPSRRDELALSRVGFFPVCRNVARVGRSAQGRTNELGGGSH
jgi:hypothetical protein